MEAEGRGVAGVSRTGHYAHAGLAPDGYIQPNRAYIDQTNLRRGKSILAREEGAVAESGLSMFKRGATLRRPNNRRNHSASTQPGRAKPAHAHKAPLGIWMIYCICLTACFPSPLLKCFGFKTAERQRAWREKMGLLSVITLAMAFVGFLTFGFTDSVCGTPANRYRTGSITGGSMIFHGHVYDLDSFTHPNVGSMTNNTNPLYDLWDAGGKDGSFLFQTVNEKCLDIITPANKTGITHSGNEMGWYFPCNLYNQFGTTAVNQTGYAAGTLCHTQTDARTQFKALDSEGQVYFKWGDLKNASRNLAVYDSQVLDLSLLQWLSTSQVSYPPLFDELKKGNATWMGKDITSMVMSSKNRDVADCMLDVIRVGFIDSITIGCVASDVVLYVSLAVIIAVVMIRFAMAVIFGWFLSWKIGRYPHETYEDRRARAAAIENWTDDIYAPAPAKFRPTVKPQKKTFLPATSRFTKKADLNKGINSQPPSYSARNRPGSSYGDLYKMGAGGMSPSLSRGMIGPGMRNSPPGSPGGPMRGSRSSTSLPLSSYNLDGMARAGNASDGMMGPCPFPLIDVVPQPAADFEPFNYPLTHTLLLVTAYSESVEGLRTTLDSLATTDYPNSHKVILVICDGMVKGSGNDLTTPEIVLGMMKDLVVPSEEVEALSYVAIADGHKRHNRAKIFAGFYDYDNNTVERTKQQRVSMMLVAKVGNPAEAGEAKPGNRGKRDSQVVLMSFLQKVMFDERMTELEYDFFNMLWRCSGVSPDKFETVLCVDADTKIFPDSVSRMVSCMVADPEIMGLCGETKIANKADTWVTMIQVFEYYVSHHLTKAFEACFGGVTCLPGCFSMYRIKAPKGGDGYWVPVLCNPDIVEKYSENVVDSLHTKNLLLLGEDRYLTTLMLTTFPRRKMMFCPQAVCKTVVPDTFGVLLSQRRRWINSTVHNLFELIVVPDLCGVFCFSMRFVVFMELAGTLVLPAAIAFTLYLIVVAIIPGTVKPIVSLVLLAIILGIPGLLIVVTSRRVAYLGWMLIYLCSLPIWNFVLPFYAFLHMDDFSWGQTRKIEGDTGGGHTDKDGQFDSSNIVMKRWADFERERRYKTGSNSRDSAYDVLHRSGSPMRTVSNRDSIVSSDTYISGAGGSGSGSGTGEALFRRGSPGMSSSETGLAPGAVTTSRYPAQLELPAPLATAAGTPRSLTPPESGEGPASSAYDYPRAGYAHHGYALDEAEAEPFSGQRLVHEPEVLSPAPAGGAFGSNNPYASVKKPRGVSLTDDGPVAGARAVARPRRSSQQSGVGAGAGGGGGHRARASMASQEYAAPPAARSGSLPPGAGQGYR